MNIFSPQFWLVCFIAALAIFGGGFIAGHKTASNACIANAAKAQTASAAVTEETNGLRSDISQAREVSRERIRTTYQTIKEQSDETTAHLSDCGLDADSLRAWNAANAASTDPLRSQPDSGLSTTATGTLGKTSRPAGEPRGNDGAIRAVSGSAAQAGSMQ